MYSDESEAGRTDLITFADLERGHGAKIKVIGVGGAGGNAVNRLIEDGMEGVEFLVANTDRQALKDSKASVRIQLGEEIARGLGAGGNPEIGKRAALEDTDKLVDALDGSDMVFVTAGLGGGTGTGAAPIIGSLATELGALTIAVVTKPFGFEGHRRATQAEQVLEELRGCVDSVITIPNERLLKSITKAIPFTDAFGLADGVLRQAVRGISDIVTLPGLINVDFADVRAIMQSKGVALMGTGQACGENRALDTERIHQRDHIGADCRLLARAQGRGIAKTRRAEAPQIGNDDAAALRGELGRNIDIAVNVVGKAVQQDRDRPVHGPRFVISYVEDTGIDVAERLQPHRGRRTRRRRG